ncbi:MAG: EcsC family protein [Fibrobacter sp.]|jgi:hypothetical protein|nr:EcsC family protein [Fibrobacter sp.]MBR2090073.1 EcsC family protein [Fibrobacter sp.]
MSNEKDDIIDLEKVQENSIPENVVATESSKWCNVGKTFWAAVSKFTKKDENHDLGTLKPENGIETSENVQNSPVIKAIDKIYGVVVDGSIPGTDSAKDLAVAYLAKYETPLKAANALVRWQNTKAAVDGAITSFGGFATMLVTLPVNVSSVLFIQIRMIAAIAYIGGIRDFKDDQLQTVVKCCLLGESISSVVKKAGIKTTEKIVLKKIMPLITGKMLTKINRIVGFRLITKFGKTGVINLGKGIPLLGSAVGAVFDGITTNIVGNAAIKTFIECNDDDKITKIEKESL